MKIRLADKFSLLCNPDGFTELEITEDDADRIVRQLKNASQARNYNGSPVRIDEDHRIRTRIHKDGQQVEVVIRGLKGKYSQIVELLARRRASVDELYARFWNRDEFEKEVSKNDVHVYLYRLRKKLKKYDLTICTDGEGKKFLKKL